MPLKVYMRMKLKIKEHGLLPIISYNPFHFVHILFVKWSNIHVIMQLLSPVGHQGDLL